MLLSNLETVPGRVVKEHLGIVQGSTVRAKHAGKDLMASFKNVVGGELKAYTALLDEARSQATDRMVARADAIGANAVLNIRYTTTSITMGTAEILVFGTAVILE